MNEGVLVGNRPKALSSITSSPKSTLTPQHRQAPCAPCAELQAEVCHTVACSRLLCTAQTELELGDGCHTQPALGHRSSDTNPLPCYPSRRLCHAASGLRYSQQPSSQANEENQLPGRVAIPREGSKLALVIEHLQRADGATIVDLTQATIALSELAVIRHATFLPSSSSRRIEAAVSKTRTTCGRSFGVVILIQRASSPPLMPTRSRSGLAVC